MTTGGDNPNENPRGGKHNPPQDPYSQQGPPPPGNYPPPGGSYPPPQQGGNYPPPQQGGSYPPPQQGGNYPPPPGSYPPPPQGGNYPPPQQGGSYPPPPPQSGGYPPPPQGGNYPPPTGGGGFPPPPPNDYGSGYPGAGRQLSVGAAITYGWNKFKNNALVWIGITLLAFVITGVIQGVTGGFNTSGEFTVLAIIGALLTTIVGYIIEAAFIRGALSELDGSKPAFGTFFQFRNVGAVILAGVLVGIATSVGLMLCVIPGLVVAFLLYYTLTFVVDKDQDAVSGIKSSYGLTSSNVGPLLLLALALIGINIIGVLLLLVGLLVTVPVSLIASTYAYRVLTGGNVTA